MKFIKFFGIAAIGLFSITSCSSGVKRYKESEYIIKKVWNQQNNYNILHLSDLHFSNVTDRNEAFDFIRETLRLSKEKCQAENLGNIDLIVITGDVFTFAERQDAIAVFDFFESLQIPWAPTWGNHDEQVYFPMDWLSTYLNNLSKDEKSYCVFLDHQDDDITGDANYIINLYKDENDAKANATPVDRLIIMDSNRYNYGEYFGYDYIHTDQIDWYERQCIAEQTYEPFLDTNIYPASQAFFHIPFPEFEESFKKAQSKTAGYSFITDKGTNKERNLHDKSNGAPKVNTHLFDKMRKYNTTGVFVGHDHMSNYCVHIDGVEEGGKTIENEISLCFAVKGTDQVYCADDGIGGQIISLIKPEEGERYEGKFDLYSILHKYAYMEGK